MHWHSDRITGVISSGLSYPMADFHRGGILPVGKSLFNIAVAIDVGKADRAAVTVRGDSAHRADDLLVGILVNKFTSVFARKHELSSVRCIAKGGQRVPSRTVRRVHVMPWATPVRRIGLTRLASLGPEDADPADYISAR